MTRTTLGPRPTNQPDKDHGDDNDDHDDEDDDDDDHRGPLVPLAVWEELVVAWVDFLAGPDGISPATEVQF